MMRRGTWAPYYNRGIIAPYHRYTGSQTVTIYVRRKQQPELTLTCSPNPVIRGEEITCTAGKKANAPGELTDIRWEFSGNGFKYPDADAGEKAPSEPTWTGEMAMSGTVTVVAKLNGAEQSKSVGVTIEARTEFRKKHVSVDVRPGTLEDVPLELGRPSDPPKDVTDLGRALTEPGILEYDPATNMADLLRIIRLIDDQGPNHGLAYLKEVPMKPTAVVVIHPALLRGSTFFRQQARTSNVVHGTAPCVQSRWDEYVRLVEEHEGLRGNRNSHVGAFGAALNPAAAESVEHLVRPTDQLAAMADEWWHLLQPVIDRATEQASNNVFHSTPGGRVRFGCEFNFDASGR
jgi:hypothetical protein